MKTTISIRFTEKEKQEIETLADMAGFTVSDYIRKRVLVGNNDLSIIQSQIRELKNSLSEMKEKLLEKSDFTQKLVIDLSPYVIKSSVAAEIQINSYKYSCFESEKKEEIVLEDKKIIDAHSTAQKIYESDFA